MKQVDRPIKKRNILYLALLERDLEDYFYWLEDFENIWLFPLMTLLNKLIDQRRFYMNMHKIGKNLEADYLRTHTMRKKNPIWYISSLTTILR